MKIGEAVDSGGGMETNRLKWKRQKTRYGRPRSRERVEVEIVKV